MKSLLLLFLIYRKLCSVGPLQKIIKLSSPNSYSICVCRDVNRNRFIKKRPDIFFFLKRYLEIHIFWYIKSQTRFFIYLLLIASYSK